ncbi:MAG TPA: hypothetical protein ENJ77_00750 [Candidatus Moranbacteria bacterium]|nr:hypothetical protein [Candidatus Moranbacteria bacterium]
MEKLHSKELSSSGGGDSTQKYVDVAEVRDGVIILKNGSLRAIVLMSSINFELKSTQEQDAITLQYQNFLNSLSFPVQILVSSRKLNINPYLKILDERERHTGNDLMRLQIAEYRAFVKNLTEITNIMSKYFYVIVPFSPVENKETGFFARMMNALHPTQAIVAKREQFETNKNQLLQRVDHILDGIGATGVRGQMLDTEEVLELLYNCYNPSLFANTDISDLSAANLRGFG